MIEKLGIGYRSSCTMLSGEKLLLISIFGLGSLLSLALCVGVYGWIWGLLLGILICILYWLLHRVLFRSPQPPTWECASSEKSPESSKAQQP